MPKTYGVDLTRGNTLAFLFIICLFWRIRFWTIGSRKPFAIPKTEYRKKTPFLARKEIKSCSFTLQSDKSLTEEVHKVKEEIGKIHKLAFNTSFLYH